ncbi:hypothetical protein GCM10020000_24940 [Streptomyces olivoverticillatus]
MGAGTRDRGRRAEEFVAVLKTLWTAEVAEHRGEFFTVPACHFGPKPVQRPHPPLLLGARALPALRRAGRIADGWIASRSSDPATLGELLATVRGAAEDAGRDPDSLRYVCRASVQVRPSGGAPFCGPAEKIRDDLARLGELGFTEAFVDLNFDPEIASVDVDAEAALGRAEAILEELAPRRRSRADPRLSVGRAGLAVRPTGDSAGRRARSAAAAPSRSSSSAPCVSCRTRGWGMWAPCMPWCTR